MEQKLKGIVGQYAMITLSCALYAVGFNWCFDPNHLSVGGFTGVAQIINFFIPQAPIGTIIVVLNLPLFILSWKKVGRQWLYATLYATLVSSGMIDLLAGVYTFRPMAPMLAAIYGGVIVGLGCGLMLRYSATTGGTELAARLLKLKFPWLPMGKLILIPDGVVLALTAIAFQRLETALFGAVALYVSSKVMDTVLYGLNASKVAYIISNHWQKISDAILAYDRGVTILNATGAYSGSEKHVLMVAFRQREIVEIKEIVHEADPAAFLIVCDAHDVLGEGFGEYQKEL